MGTLSGKRVEYCFESTASVVLPSLRKRDLTEFLGKVSEFCAQRLGEFAFGAQMIGVVVTFELCMLTFELCKLTFPWKVVTFELCWPPFCRKKRFWPPNSAKLDLHLPKKNWKKGHTKQLRLSSAEISVFW